MKKGSVGFTLLEILAALAVVTVGMAAVAKTVGGATTVLQAVEDRMLGSWVASNRLAAMRLSRSWPAANTSDRTAVLGGRTWHYREQVSTTRDPDLLRVDVTVYGDDEHEHQAAILFGYIARYSPPSDPPLAGAENNPPGGAEGNEQGGETAFSGQSGDESQPGASDAPERQ